MLPALSEGNLLAERYRLERILGQGGMGVVWGALDERTRERVALKILKRDVARRDRRLVREARILTTMTHPGLVRVFDVFAGPGDLPVIVMEQLRGETLAGRLAARGALPLAEVARVLLPVAAVLGVAHEAGVVHRDIKPDNIFLVSGETPGGGVRLLDFGIAKLLADCGPLAASDVLTATGVRLGSALYMAPEQAAGDAVDAQADVWSMGIVLYECLTGVCPTRAGRGSAAIESLLPHVPEAIAALSASMLERDPIKRARGLKPSSTSSVPTPTPPRWLARRP